MKLFDFGPTARRMRARGRSDAGAFDLISVLVGVLIVGILSAVAMASLGAVIPWSQDEAARASLGSIATAQSTSRIVDGQFLDGDGLEAAELLGVAPDGLEIWAGADGECWGATMISGSGRTFWAGSERQGAREMLAGSEPSCAGGSAVVVPPVAFDRIAAGAALRAAVGAVPTDGQIVSASVTGSAIRPAEVPWDLARENTVVEVYVSLLVAVKNCVGGPAPIPITCFPGADSSASFQVRF